MPDYLFDTNILFLMLQKPELVAGFEARFGLLNSPNHFICSVSHGELKALATRNVWGPKRWERLHKMRESFSPVSIDGNKASDAYAEIEQYNANKHALKIPDKQARKMGKNDIWIAAAGLVLGATVVTTDKKGFSHFRDDFLKVELLTPQGFK
jgi:predicted nucleic acid-binding protein